MSTPCVLLGTSHLSIISVFADQKKKKKKSANHIYILNFVSVIDSEDATNISFLSLWCIFFMDCILFCTSLGAKNNCFLSITKIKYLKNKDKYSLRPN